MNELPASWKFFCLYKTRTDNIIFIDSIMGNYDYTFLEFKDCGFDHSGEYFYYRKLDHALRFNIETSKIDTIPGGESPLVPWNAEGLAVYSDKENKVSLLNDDWDIVMSLEAKLDIPVLTTYVIDSLTYLVGSSHSYNDKFPFYEMSVYLVDFRNMVVERLFIARSHGQIIDATRIE